MKHTYEELLAENKALKSKIKVLNNEIREKLFIAEEKAKENEHKFNAFTNQAVEGITVADIDGNYVFVNPAFCKMAGYTEHELLKLTVFDMKAKNQAPSSFFDSKEKMEGIPIRVNLQRKDKTEYLTEIVGKIVILGNQKLVLGTIRDISERVKIEKELIEARERAEENEEKFKKLSNLTFEGILIHKRGIALDINLSFANMFNYSREELLGKNVIKLLVPSKYHPLIYKNIVNNYALPYQVEGVKKDGSIMPIEIESKTVHTDNNHKIRVVAIRDITERKKAELDLKRSEKRYKSLFKENNSIMLIIDPDSGKILDVNKAACNFYGYSFSQFAQMNISQINMLPAKELKNAMQHVKNDKQKHFIFKHKLANKQIRDVEIFGGKVELTKKAVLYSIVHDITDKIRIENALKESEAKLRVSNDTKDKFFSIIAHDLKSPFNALIGFSELLVNKHKTYTEEKRELIINTIHKVTKNTYQLLENLLSWSHSQSGLMKFKPEKIRIKTVVERITILLQEAAANKNIKLLCDIKTPILAFADINMLESIIRNLISNAIKFTEKQGSIFVSAKEIKNNDFVEISVTDTGVGISKEMIDKLFYIDKTISTKGTEKEEGTGLGLVLCKEFIEKHNGNIRVESTLGKGSSFIFSLPVYKANNKS